MLTDSAIESYVNSIPPLPKIVRECSELLGKGDLVAAANKASEDRALIQYLQILSINLYLGFVQM